MSTALSVDRPGRQRSVAAAERISQARTILASISPNHRGATFSSFGESATQRPRSRPCSALTKTRLQSSRTSLTSEDILSDRRFDADGEGHHRSHQSLSGLKRAESFADQLATELSSTSLFAGTNVGLLLTDTSSTTDASMNGSSNRKDEQCLTTADPNRLPSPTTDNDEGVFNGTACYSNDVFTLNSDQASENRQPECSDGPTPVPSMSPVLSPEKDGMMFEYFGLDVVDKPAERRTSTSLAPAECNTGLLSFRLPMCVGGSASVSPTLSPSPPLALADLQSSSSASQLPAFARRKEDRHVSLQHEMPTEAKRKSTLGRFLDRMVSFRGKRESNTFSSSTNNDQDADERPERPASLYEGYLSESASCPSLNKAGRESEGPTPEPNVANKKKRSKSFRKKIQRLKGKKTNSFAVRSSSKSQRQPLSGADLLQLTRPRSEQDLVGMIGEERETIGDVRGMRGAFDFRQSNGTVRAQDVPEMTCDRKNTYGKTVSTVRDHEVEGTSYREEQSLAGRYGDAIAAVHNNSTGTASTAISVFSSAPTDESAQGTKAHSLPRAEAVIDVSAAGKETSSTASPTDHPSPVGAGENAGHGIVVRPKDKRVAIEVRTVRTRSVEGLLPSYPATSDRSGLADLALCGSLERLQGHPELESEWEATGRVRSASDHRNAQSAPTRRRQFRRADSSLSRFSFEERSKSRSLNNLWAWTKRSSKPNSSTMRGSSGDVNCPFSPTNRRAEGVFSPTSVRSVVGLGPSTSMESVGASSLDSRSSRLASGRFGGSLSMSEQQLADAISERVVTPPPGQSDFQPPIKSKVDLTPEDMRQHVLQNLLESEHKYVMSLRVLEKDYLNTLKAEGNGLLVDASVADEIFYKIPVVNLCHKAFYKHLCEKVEKWHDEQTLGDVFLQSFSKGILSETYTAFINHYMQSKDAVGTALAQRPGFAKFLDQVYRGSDDKLKLSDLLIMPVQRIPRYVLIIKDLLKHTPPSHPDHALLLQALGEVISLAEKMNSGEQYANQIELLRELEYCFDGAITGLVSPHRYLIRRDRVSEEIGGQQKDRMLILLSDMVLCATVRRRTSSRKSHHPLWVSADTNVKYKLMWRAPLRELRVDAIAADKSVDKQAGGVSRTEEDLITLGQISSLTEKLHISHQDLFNCIDNLVRVLNDQMLEKNSIRRQSVAVLSHGAKRGGTTRHPVTFQSIEDKNTWIGDFSEAKEKLAQPAEGISAWYLGPGAVVHLTVRIPTFLHSTGIARMKTRSGMQITCASSTIATSCLTPAAIKARANGQLWVCNSDGHVGQVCMVNTDCLPPRLTACITVCDARITCINAVPEYVPPAISDFIARNKIADSDDEFDTDSGSENSDNDSDSSDTLADDEATLSAISVTASDNSSFGSAERAAQGSSPPDGVRLRHPSARTARGNRPSVVLEEKEEGFSPRSSCAREGYRPTSLISVSSHSDARTVESLFSSVMKQLESKLLLVKAALNLNPLSQTKTLGGRRYSQDKHELRHSMSANAAIEHNEEAISKKPLDRSQSNPVDRTTSSDVKADRDVAVRSKQPEKHNQILGNRMLNENLRSHPTPHQASAKGVRRKDVWRTRTTLSPSSMDEFVGEVKSSDDVCNLIRSMVNTIVAVEEIGLKTAHDHNRHDLLLEYWRKESLKESCESRVSEWEIRDKVSQRTDGADDRRQFSAVPSQFNRENSVCSEMTMAGRHPLLASMESDERRGGSGCSSMPSTVDDSQWSDVVSRSDSDVSSSSRFRHMRRRDSLGWQSGNSDISDGRMRRCRSPGHGHERVRRPAPHMVVRQATNVTPGGFGSENTTKIDHNPTMWIGTDNGQLYIYRAGDSIRMRQRRTVLSFKSAIVCMCNTESHVFAAFQDGSFLMFSRNTAGDWDTLAPDEILIGQPKDVVNCMVVVRREPWCACKNYVHIVNLFSLDVKKSFRVSANLSIKVACMVVSGLSVYIALENSTVIHVYHALSQEHLLDIDTLPSVREILAGCDAIIRQHKIPRLRLTTLQSFRNLIWVGTSAGVVLTIPATLGIRRSTNAADIVKPPQPQASYHGHTGPVHFISCIDRESKVATKSESKTDDVQFRERSGSRSHRQHILTESLSNSSLQNSSGQCVDLSAMEADCEQYMPLSDTQGLVISGGDGYEDFKASALNLPDEDFSHDDTSSHLLMWETH